MFDLSVRAVIPEDAQATLAEPSFTGNPRRPCAEIHIHRPDIRALRKLCGGWMVESRDLT
jgi:hypothetical protein